MATVPTKDEDRVIQFVVSCGHIYRLSTSTATTVTMLEMKINQTTQSTPTPHDDGYFI